MRRLKLWYVLGFVAVLAALAGCGGSGGTTTTSTTSAAGGNGGKTVAEGGGETSEGLEATPEALTAAASPSNEELEGAAGANWQTVGGGLSNERFSSLTKIDTSNASKLHLVWQESFGPEITPTSFKGGAAVEVEGQPIVSEGFMFIPTPQGDVVAVDAATGKTIWRYKSTVTKANNVSEFGLAQRGLAIGEGKVFIGTAAGKLVALDASTGEEAWSAKFTEPGTKMESPGVPVYFDNTIYIGSSGAESGRGTFWAYNAETGKQEWSTTFVCGPAETPPSSGKCPKKESANEGGGSVWTWPAVEPKKGIVYVTTANPSEYEIPGIGKSQANLHGDDKWATSIVALDMKTGEIKWGFQAVHHDLWDYDCPAPPVLFQAEVGGSSQDTVEFTCKSDEHFELNQETGKPVLPVKEVTVPTEVGGKTPDPAAQKHYAASPTQPIPAGNSELVPHCATPAFLPNPAPDGSKYTYSCTFAAPGGSKSFMAQGINANGGQDWSPLAYNPELEQMYFCEGVSFRAGKINSSKVGGAPFEENQPWSGTVAGVSVKNNNTVWLDKQSSKESRCYGGDTATAGDLVFSTGYKGSFAAYDAENGEQLWTYKAPEYIADPPVVFEAGGKEYVALYVGGQDAINGGMTTKHPDRMMVFSVEAEPLPSASFEESAPTPEEEAEAVAGGDEAETLEEGTAASPGELFETNCGTCHTLAAAGTTGTEGPNLDQLKPSLAAVEQQVINGGGAMPAFGKDHILTKAQVKEVSEYVADEAGKK